MKVGVDIITLDEWLPKVDNPKKCRGCGRIVDNVNDFANEKYQLCEDCIQLMDIFPTEDELKQMEEEDE